MRRLSRLHGGDSIAAIALLLAAGRAASAQDVYISNGTSTTWGKNTATSWTGPHLYPGLSARGNGGGSDTDIAEYLAIGNLATSPRNISFDATGLYGVGSTLTVGTIVYAPTTNDGTNAFALSTLTGSTTAGTLSFTGASLYGASHVILANESAGSAVMTIMTGTTAPAMSLGLAAGVNTIVAGVGTATGYGDSVVLNCAVAGSATPGGSSITFLGGGSASVNGGTLAFDTAPSGATVTGITVGAADGSSAGRLRFKDASGMPAGSAGIVVNTNSQMVLSSSVLGATYGTAAQTVTLNGAGTRTDAGALLFNPGGTSKSVSLAANVLLASDSAIGVTDTSASPTNTLTLSGSLSGSGILTKTGNGILALSGTNHLTGGTVISAGTLQVNAGSSLGTGDLTFVPTGTGRSEIDFNTGGQVLVGNLSSTFHDTAASAEIIQIGSGTTLVLAQTANTRYGNALSGQTAQINGLGGLALSAASTGTLTFGIAVLTYGGDTTIDGGTLNVLGHLGSGPLDSPSSAGQVIVHAGGTLSGTGQIASASTDGAVFLSGGTLSPGDITSGSGVGTLSLTSLVLGTGSVMDFQLGTISDQVQVNRFFFKSADATGQFQIGFSDAGRPIPNALHSCVAPILPGALA